MSQNESFHDSACQGSSDTPDINMNISALSISLPVHAHGHSDAYVIQLALMGKQKIYPDVHPNWACHMKGGPPARMGMCHADVELLTCRSCFIGSRRAVGCPVDRRGHLILRGWPLPQVELALVAHLECDAVQLLGSCQDLLQGGPWTNLPRCTCAAPILQAIQDTCRPDECAPTSIPIKRTARLRDGQPSSKASRKSMPGVSCISQIARAWLGRHGRGRRGASLATMRRTSPTGPKPASGAVQSPQACSNPLYTFLGPTSISRGELKSKQGFNRL